MTTVAALVFVAVSAAVIAFQVAMALGAPWGAYAMGGRFVGRYPRPMRVAALAQSVLLALIALVVLADAHLVLPAVGGASPWLIWLVVAFSAVAAVLNTITPSARERRLWAPATIVMLASSLVVALT